MARVETVTRASTVFEIYKRLAPDLEIVELHTGIKGVGAREEARRKDSDKGGAYRRLR